MEQREFVGGVVVGIAALDRRLGVRQIVEDHVESWSNRVGAQRMADRYKWAAWFFLVPTVFAIPFIFLHVNLRGVGQILAGVAVFTGLLFGLLGVIFNIGVTLRKDGDHFRSAHGLPMTISDLRANITYAIFVAIILDVALVVAAAVTDPNCGLAWAWTPVIVWLFMHLGLTLLMVLKRFRTAFNYITR